MEFNTINVFCWLVDGKLAHASKSANLPFVILNNVSRSISDFLDYCVEMSKSSEPYRSEKISANNSNSATRGDEDRQANPI
jgi:hypothetical protein